MLKTISKDDVVFKKNMWTSIPGLGVSVYTDDNGNADIVMYDVRFGETSESFARSLCARKYIRMHMSSGGSCRES